MNTATAETDCPASDDAVVKPLKPRLVAAIVAGAGLALLITAATLTPSADGTGTHKQLGLPSCSVLKFSGVPCPSCGMTTSFSHAADGRLDRAFVNQPFGALLAVVTAMAVLVSLYIVVSGHNIARYLRPMWNLRTGIIAIVLFLGAWVYKIVLVTGSGG